MPVAFMDNRSLIRIKEFDIKTALESLMLLSLLVVWVVWPLRGTIAARNIALISGAIASVAWLCIERPKFAISDFLPIGFLLFVPAWLLGLYIFNPVVPNLQWDDLRGTWLRVVIAIIFSVGLGRLYLLRPQKKKYFIWILFIWPVVILFLFVSQGLFTQSWFGEQIYIYVFKSKVAGVYFLVWSLLLCFAMMHWYLLRQKSFKSNLFESNTSKKLLLVALFSICLINYFSLRSLNGFIIIFCCFTSIAFVIMGRNSARAHLKDYFIKVFIVWAGIIIFVMAVLAYDIKYSGSKLVNLASDINFIVNEDVTGAWKWNGSYKGPYPPTNTISGNAVNGSTYERVAWPLEGIKFLNNHPFGLGYTGQAFSYYMKKFHSGSGATKTHSGWLDFALGAGYVGLIAVWSAMGIVFLRARKITKNYPRSSQMPIYIYWAVGVLMLLWLVAELSDREYIEHFFFVMAFFSLAINAPKHSVIES